MTIWAASTRPDPGAGLCEMINAGANHVIHSTDVSLFNPVQLWQNHRFTGESK